MVKVNKDTLDEIANSVKVSQGSCNESSLEVLWALKARGIFAQMLWLPNQNHAVVGLGNHIIDLTMEVNYGVNGGERVFEREQHEKIILEIASKEPFCFYMGKEIIYKPVRLPVTSNPLI